MTDHFDAHDVAGEEDRQFLVLDVRHEANNNYLQDGAEASREPLRLHQEGDSLAPGARATTRWSRRSTVCRRPS